MTGPEEMLNKNILMIELKCIFLQETCSSEPTPTPTGLHHQKQVWVTAVHSTTPGEKAGEGVGLGGLRDNGGDQELPGRQEIA